MTIDEFRYNSKKLKAVFMNQISSRLSEMLEDVADTFEKSVDSDSSSASQSLLSKGYNIDLKDKKKPDKIGKLPEKEFKVRDSPLTELLEVCHFRTIYHIFIASLILMLLHTMLGDITNKGTVDLGLENLLWAFGDTQRAIGLVFTLHFISIFLLYPSFYYWANSRLRYSKESRATFDKIAAAIFVIFVLAFTVIPGRLLWKTPLPWVNGMICGMEQARLLMKMYAFVRSNVPRALNFEKKEEDKQGKNSSEKLESVKETNEETGRDINQNTNVKYAGLIQRRTPLKRSESEQLGLRQGSESSDDERCKEAFLKKSVSPRPEKRVLTRKESWLSWDVENHPCPDFTKYLYFLFAPTLIYKDEYPRSRVCRWSFVFWNFAQCVGCVLYSNFVLSRFCESTFASFGVEGQQISGLQLLASIFSLMIPGTFMLVLGFFLILHAWQNAFAEMLYFGDRLFYKPWWLSSNFGIYYKTWNCLVHDWLYTYVFKDAWESGLGKKYKALPTSLVFLISALFHEYILCISFNFFFPACLILFGGFGFLFMFIGNRKKNSVVGNVLMWMALISGTGVLLSSYTMEAYARRNCVTPSNNPIYDFFVPRTVSCNAISFFS